MGALRSAIPAFEIIALRRSMWSNVIGQRVFLIESRRVERVSVERYSESFDGGVVVNNKTEIAFMIILVVSQRVKEGSTIHP